MKFIFFKLKLFFILVWLTTSVQGMSHKIDRSFKLKFWDVEVGHLDIKGDITPDSYNISTIGYASRITNFFKKLKISSGSVGKVDNRGDLVPIKSMSRWQSRGESRQSMLSYKNGRLSGFEFTPELKKDYHIDDPVGIKNTIDPVSLIAWFLRDQSENELCTGRLMVLDGFRMSELIFLQRTKKQNSIKCIGNLNRIKGFKLKQFAKKPLTFELEYSLQSDGSSNLKNIKIETMFGNLKLY